jgi:hypothetical protein
MKTKSIARLTNDAAALLQKLVRMKAADSYGMAECVTCGVRKHWKELQGGHFISRVKTAHKLLEENIHPQCQRCNGPLRGNPIPYSLYMIDTYGREFVDELERTKNQGIKYCRADLLIKIRELKSEIEECSTKL